jgi:hypothetical protein
MLIRSSRSSLIPFLEIGRAVNLVSARMEANRAEKGRAESPVLLLALSNPYFLVVGFQGKWMYGSAH